MSYLKAILLSAVVALAIIFMVQNMEALSHPLAIRLNLLFVQFESSAYATYLVILLAFFAGLLAASLLGLVERYRLRREIRGLHKEINGLNQELSSLRNLPITGEPVSQAENRHLPEAEEQAL